MKTRSQLKALVSTVMTTGEEDDITALELKNILDEVIDSSMPTRIAVLGDSLSAQNYAIGENWSSKLQTLFNQNGVSTEVKAFAIPGASFAIANTMPLYNNITMVQAAVNYAPDIVIVALGINDTVSANGSAIIGDVQAAAATTFGTLRTQLPDAKIYYAKEIAYDEANFPGTVGLKNKAGLAGFMDFNTTGPEAYKFTDSILENPIAASRQISYSHWSQLMAYIDILATTNGFTIDGTFDLDLWKIGRLGLSAPGGIHLSDSGKRMVATSVLEGLFSVSAPITAGMTDFTQIANKWNSLDIVFDAALTQVGDGYVTNLEWMDNEKGYPMKALGIVSPDSWYMSYKASAELFPKTLTSTGAYTDYYQLNIRGARPYSQLFATVAGGAAFPILRTDGATPIFTDGNGDLTNVNTMATLGLGAGTYQFKFIVGDTVFPSISITQG